MNDQGNNDIEFWDEYDWEEALRETDKYAARYFELLKRFSDLPDSDQLIANQMRNEFKQEFLEENGDFYLGVQMMEEFGDLDDLSDLEDEDFNVEKGGEDEFSIPEAGDDEKRNEGEGKYLDPEMEKWLEEEGDTYLPEAHPAYKALRQVSISWSNVFAVVFPQVKRKEALKAVFMFGRALGALCYSLDGYYTGQQEAGIAFGKRCLHYINVLHGMMCDLVEEMPQLENVLQKVIEQLQEARVQVFDFLQVCRNGDSASQNDDLDDDDLRF